MEHFKLNVNHNHDRKASASASITKNQSNKNNVVVEEDNNDYSLYEESLGKEFINQKCEPLNCYEIFKTPIIGLLFVTQWCNPSQHFIKDVIEVYNESNQGIKTLEIIQVTIEKDILPGEKPEETERIRKEEDMKFKQYITDKPWAFINYLDSKSSILKAKYNIKAVPKLIILNRDLSIMIDDGRKEISDEGYCVGEKWLKMILSQNNNDFFKKE